MTFTWSQDLSLSMEIPYVEQRFGALMTSQSRYVGIKLPFYRQGNQLLTFLACTWISSVFCQNQTLLCRGPHGEEVPPPPSPSPSPQVRNPAGGHRKELGLFASGQELTLPVGTKEAYLDFPPVDIIRMYLGEFVIHT